MNPTRSTVLAAAILVAAGGAVTGVANAQPEPSPTPSTAPAPPPASHAPSAAAPGPAPEASEDAEGSPDAPSGPQTSITADGTYQVGVDIVPGTYSSAGPITDGVCYWKRTSNGELVDNALTKKPQVVQIKADDTTFTTNDCQAWQLTNATPPPQPGPQDLLGQLGSFIGSGILSGPPPS
ncbi:hypothetical protein ABQF17_03075 [Mycolicibacterium elephantis]|uniref:Lipoprotein n=2 Tax=Mycolicibacterium elephantis TaxID=81858 RepID=A0A1X0CT88_9MYCO|nr:hypothetical protein [Mycolicibacterium elephantis]OBA74012.1 hypothetical protein A5633_21085 [Mycolicibacterium elephantis]OBF00946.1 hypothetical protein A5776_09010 [Mycolicibacterium elephantis]ORA63325.1 hypothetical protein BST23_18450 [Mycolicibacterium elephantis]